MPVCAHLTRVGGGDGTAGLTVDLPVCQLLMEGRSQLPRGQLELRRQPGRTSEGPTGPTSMSEWRGVELCRCSHLFHGPVRLGGKPSSSRLCSVPYEPASPSHRDSHMAQTPTWPRYHAQPPRDFPAASKSVHYIGATVVPPQAKHLGWCRRVSKREEGDSNAIFLPLGHGGRHPSRRLFHLRHS